MERHSPIGEVENGEDYHNHYTYEDYREGHERHYLHRQITETYVGFSHLVVKEFSEPIVCGLEVPDAICLDGKTRHHTGDAEQNAQSNCQQTRHLCKHETWRCFWTKLAELKQEHTSRNTAQYHGDCRQSWIPHFPSLLLSHHFLQLEIPYHIF